MANVGTAPAGKTLIGAGNGASPTYADIGTNSGLTANGVVIAQGNSPFQSIPLTNGQVLIGSTGTNPNPSTLTAGTGVTITNGAGIITISANSSVVGMTVTADSGGPLSPVAGNWNFLGGTNVTTSGAGNTITINAADGGLTPDDLLATSLEWDDFVEGYHSDNSFGKLHWQTALGGVIFGVSDSGHPGQVSFTNTYILLNETGTNTTYIMGGGVFTLDWVVKIANTTGATSYIGMFDALTVSVNGMWFEHNSGVNSGNWQIKCQSATTTTTANTSTAATTDWTHFRIVVNAAATSVAFYIDGAEVANSPIATNIPTTQIGPGCRINGAIEMACDLAIMQYALTTSRV